MEKDLKIGDIVVLNCELEVEEVHKGAKGIIKNIEMNYLGSLTYEIKLLNCLRINQNEVVKIGSCYIEKLELESEEA